MRRSLLLFPLAGALLRAASPARSRAGVAGLWLVGLGVGVGAAAAYALLGLGPGRGGPRARLVGKVEAVAAFARAAGAPITAGFLDELGQALARGAPPAELERLAGDAIAAARAAACAR